MYVFARTSAIAHNHISRDNASLRDDVRVALQQQEVRHAVVLASQSATSTLSSFRQAEEARLEGLVDGELGGVDVHLLNVPQVAAPALSLHGTPLFTIQLQTRFWTVVSSSGKAAVVHQAQ